MKIRVYDVKTNTYYDKEVEEPTQELITEPTEIELIQQNITDLELNDIEQGQMITELELMILGGIE